MLRMICIRAHLPCGTCVLNVRMQAQRARSAQLWQQAGATGSPGGRRCCTSGGGRTWLPGRAHSRCCCGGRWPAGSASDTGGAKAAGSAELRPHQYEGAPSSFACADARCSSAACLRVRALLQVSMMRSRPAGRREIQVQEQVRVERLHQTLQAIPAWPRQWVRLAPAPHRGGILKAASIRCAAHLPTHVRGRSQHHWPGAWSATVMISTQRRPRGAGC